MSADKMPAGTYYIGDLCYVMTRDEWAQCQNLFNPDGNSLPVEGYFTLNNKRFASFDTPGDGPYKDQTGNTYSVDSGSIGCILLENIDDSKQADVNPNNVFAIDHDFECSSDGSMIYIDNIYINLYEDYDTGDWEEES